MYFKHYISVSCGKNFRFIRTLKRPSHGKLKLANLCWQTQTDETQRVKAVLRDNNYPMSYIRNCERALTKQPAENSFNGFVALPYVQGVSEKIGCILKQQKVKVAYKPQQTINSLFPRPKELDDSDRQKSGIVYKIKCTQCNFCVLWPNRKIIKDQNCGAQKGSAKF